MTSWGLCENPSLRIRPLQSAPLYSKLLNWLAARRAQRLIAKGLQNERQGRAGEAKARFQAAVAIAPAYAPAHLNLGIVLEALGDASAAERSFERAHALEPGNVYAGYNLGKVLLQRGDHARAERILRAALAQRPDFPEAHVLFAHLLEGRGDDAGALQSLQTAVALRPRYAGAHRNLGLLLARLQRWPDAVRALQLAVSADDADADAHFWLGNALVHRQRPAEGEQAFRRAVALRPEFALAWVNLGNVLNDRGLRDQAAHCQETALRLDPSCPDAHLGLGNVLAGAGRLNEAAACYRQALALDPQLADAKVNLGNALKDQGLRRAAIEQYEAALALDQDAAQARWALAMCHIPAVREAHEGLSDLRAGFAAELESLDRWFDDRRALGGWKAVGVAQPFWLAYQESNNRDLLQRYGLLCARLMAPWQAEHAPRSRAGSARSPLRVGIVSQFFRDHSVWNAIMKGWFQELDGTRFALQAFCLDPNEDAQTRYARSRAARFEQGHAGLRQWATVIQDAQPDVLIYPEVGMDPMSAKLASMRLAPVQAASWGHPETTGLPTMDYYLSAQDFEPGNAQAHYVERLVALPHLGCCVQPDPTDPAPANLAELGIESGVPLLICAGTPFKYAPEHDGVLAGIARRLGRCQLLLFEYRTSALSDALRARLASHFTREGLDFERCVRFLPWQSRPGFHGVLRRADVYLDTIGFSGFNTALQAVECNLPIVTREGRFLRGRLASGMLKRVGLSELVVSDEEQYVTLAVRLARDAGYREDIRRRMADGRHLLYGDTAPIRALEAFLGQGV
jgi:predicted O-linked N-acetylglucosamine transferase (SPINDLY family)